jgi:hypothetical protein
VCLEVIGGRETKKKKQQSELFSLLSKRELSGDGQQKGDDEVKSRK